MLRGKWLETESAIPRAQVPQAINDTVAKEFKDCKVIEIQSVERPNESALLYELHLDTGPGNCESSVFSPRCNLTRSTKPKK